MEATKPIGKNCIGEEWSEDKVKLKQERDVFLTGKSSGKAYIDNAKKKRKFPGGEEPVPTEMYEHNWNIWFYVRLFIKKIY